MSYKKKAEKNIKWYPLPAVEHGEVETWRVVEQALLDLAVFVLFMLAAAWQFESLIAKAEGSSMDIIPDKSKLIVSALLVIFAMDVLAVVWNKFRFPIYGGVCLISVVKGVIWARQRLEELEMGFCQIVHIYAGWIEKYHKISVVSPTGRVGDMPVAALFALGVGTITLLLLSGWCGKRLVMGIFPLMILAAGMLVGYTPDGRSMMVLFLGIMLSQAGGWNRDTVYCYRSRQGREPGALFRLVPVLIALGMAVLIAGSTQGIGQGAAGRIADMGVEVKSIQQQMEAKLRELAKGNQKEDFGQVDNHTPQYQNREVLQVTLEGNPADHQYLRGDFGTYYMDGYWITTQDDFEKECRKNKYDSAEMGALISSYGGETARAILERKDIYTKGADYSVRKCSIRYTGLETETSYMPYYLRMPITSSEESYSADVRLKKSPEVNQTDWYVWRAPSDFGYPSYLYPDKDMLEESDPVRSDLPGESWYEKYVLETYRSGSGSVPSAVEIARGIQENAHGQGNENLDRIMYAGMVADYLSDFSYSLSLKETPVGQDAVEYFLSDSHIGYCTHFATAGTLILRELGVPARYASGYIVRKSSFQKGKTGGYFASVKDQDAHAWVEIYMDKIGWVPVEMTPGYSQNQNYPLEEVSETESQNQQETETQRESQETQQRETQQPEPETTLSSRQPDPGTQQAEQAGERDQGGSSRWLLWIFLAVAGVGGVAFGEIYLFQRQRRIASTIEMEIRRKRNRRVVKHMNRRIYRKLRRVCSQREKNMSDEGYRDHLIQSFPQVSKEEWMRFSVIVQKAYFAPEEVEEEEVKFIHSIYREIFYKS